MEGFGIFTRVGRLHQYGVRLSPSVYISDYMTVTIFWGNQVVRYTRTYTGESPHIDVFTVIDKLHNLNLIEMSYKISLDMERHYPHRPRGVPFRVLYLGEIFGEDSPEYKFLKSSFQIESWVR